jgi:asparagine synthase (glutamine-hydrolysing)
MCGIAGKISSSQVDHALVERMCDVVEHRGPDSRGIFVREGVGLGIQRLAIIDLDTGDQPIFNEDGSLVVVLNGEIYNYRELRDELMRSGHRFSTKTDTEVIVHLYEDHGDACVEHLRGMFAFALWDTRRRRLLVGRDRVGKKPLFYAHRGSSFWFASEAKSILQDPQIPRDVDYAAIDNFLQYGYVPHPRSAFAALRKLPAAHTLVFEDDNVAINRYWKLSYRKKIDVSAPEELHELIRSNLLEATRIRLRSDVPLGAFLSGGVDSSAVVAAMATLAGDRVKTFSIGFASDEFDETVYAREVASLFDTEHHEFRVEPHAVELLPRLVWHYGEPFADQSAIPTFYLSEVTRRHVTVALNGDGGDENFAGYFRYFGNKLAAQLEWVPEVGANAATSLLRFLGTGSTIDSTRSRLLRLASSLTMSRAERYAMWMSIFSEAERERLYSAEFRASVNPAAAVETISGPYDESDATEPIERLLDVDVQSYLVDQLLVKVDIASMAHSLEVRSPLLDHVFMEMAASLPSEAKLNGRISKQVFKDSIRSWIPDHVLDRPKRGFAIPLREWFQRDLRELPGQILLDPRSLERGLFREETIRQIIDSHLAGVADNSAKIWALMQLEVWFRTFVDEVRGTPVAGVTADSAARYAASPL